ncbi:MAG: cupin domain-containing protein [Lachnospiraceae bacterium]|jgi:quercetin dioxygenase-like cupin family protein|nr:cupin domain-containing protein [Lachnospiraceae bacterium]
MLKKNEDFTVEQEHAENGLGNFTMRYPITGKELPPHMRLMCEVIIEPGQECRTHVHEGDTEIYYMLSGRAEYTGAEGTNTLKPGDVTVCYDGESHAIRCVGDETLRFLAFIPYTK